MHFIYIAIKLLCYVNSRKVQNVLFPNFVRLGSINKHNVSDQILQLDANVYKIK